MVDHERATNKKFSATQDTFASLRCGREDFSRYRKINHATHAKLLRSVSIDNELSLATEKGDRPEEETETRHGNLSVILSDLQKLSIERKRTSDAKKIKRLEIAYKNNMQYFLTKLDDILLSARSMRHKLITSLRTFHVISRRTEGFILVSSVANFAVMVGSLMHKIFRVSWNSKLFLIPTVTGALTFTSSLMAVTYMNQTTSDFYKDMSKEFRLIRSLIAILEKGDRLDAEVSKLFPYGINLNLIDFENTNYYRMKPEWKEYLCSRIIQSNIEKDKELLRNEDFLMNVKLFVENRAAEIWWCRMKIKKLLEVTLQKTNETFSKEFLSSHENVIYRTALCIYPVIIPWITTSRAPNEIKFLINALGGYCSALQLRNDGSEELANLKRVCINFEKNFKEIYKICAILVGSED